MLAWGRAEFRISTTAPAKEGGFWSRTCSFIIPCQRVKAKRTCQRMEAEGFMTKYQASHVIWVILLTGGKLQILNWVCIRGELRP